MNKIETLVKMVKLTLFPNFAVKVANDYWKNTTRTHTDMSEERFDYYYQELKKLIKPTKNEKLLDYGGGNGEIAYRFLKDGFDISHCDINNEMIKYAKALGLNSCNCSEIKGKFDVIIIHNAFFYIHPKYHKSILKKLYNHLKKNGRLYITDTPDFEKRNFLDMKKLKIFITHFLPIYQIESAVFFIKHKSLQKLAKEIGFRQIQKVDSWANYRSHWILKK